MSWWFSCLAIALTVAAILCLPIARHPTLPRRGKLVLSLVIFAVLVPGGLALYGWVGVPLMGLL